MRAIKVSIEMNGFLVWHQHFTNYPTCKELLPFIPEARRSAPDARAFVQQLCSSQWCISYEPKRIIQYVSSLGVVIGRIVMEEVSIFQCDGFDPTKTVPAEAVVTGGSFTLTDVSQDPPRTTADIAFDADQATIESALDMETPA